MSDTNAKDIDLSYFKEGLVYCFNHPHAADLKGAPMIYIGYDADTDRYQFHSMQSNKVWPVQKTHLNVFVKAGDDVAKAAVSKQNG